MQKGLLMHLKLSYCDIGFTVRKLQSLDLPGIRRYLDVAGYKHITKLDKSSHKFSFKDRHFTIHNPTNIFIAKD